MSDTVPACQLSEVESGNVEGHPPLDKYMVVLILILHGPLLEYQLQSDAKKK